MFFSVFDATLSSFGSLYNRVLHRVSDGCCAETNEQICPLGSLSIVCCDNKLRGRLDAPASNQTGDKREGLNLLFAANVPTDKAADYQCQPKRY